jgi:hypothetical protein
MAVDFFQPCVPFPCRSARGGFGDATQDHPEAVSSGSLGLSRSSQQIKLSRFTVHLRILIHRRNLQRSVRPPFSSKDEKLPSTLLLQPS